MFILLQPVTESLLPQFPQKLFKLPLLESDLNQIISELLGNRGRLLWNDGILIEADDERCNQEWQFSDWTYAHLVYLKHEGVAETPR